MTDIAVEATTELGQRVTDAIVEWQSGPGTVLNIAATDLVDLVRHPYEALRLDPWDRPDWCGDCNTLRDSGHDDCPERVFEP